MNTPHKLSGLSLMPIVLILPALACLGAQESIFPDSVGPAAEYYDAPSWELGTIFRPTAPGQITQVRVWSLSDESSNHVVSIWQNSPETLLFRTNWSFGGDNAWIALPIPPLRVLANADYTVSITTTAAGMYPANSDYFDLAGDDGQYLSWPQGAGVFSDTVGNRPTGSFGNSAYLRDIVFEADSVFPVIGVLGNGQAIPSGDVAPSLSDGTQFGGVSLGDSSQIETFTVHNSGTANLVLPGVPPVVVTGPQAGDFTVHSQPASSLSPGENAAFTIQFAPSGPGFRNATVTLTNNAGSPYQFAVEGIGMGGGGYTVLGDQSAVTVQTIPVGQINGSRFEAMRNMRLTQMRVRVAQMSSASGSAVLKAAVYSDKDGAPDQLLSGTSELSNPTNGWYSLPLTQAVNVLVASNYWLVVWASADVVALYADSAGQQQFGYYPYDVTWPQPLNLTDGATDGTLCLYAEGTPAGDSGPEMEVQGGGQWVPSGATNATPANGTDFGSCSLYGGTLSQTFTILNIGAQSASLALTGAPAATVTGPDAADFVITNQPASTVTPGSSTTFTITFTPSAAGIRSGTVVIPHADSSAAYQFAIQAEGLYPPGAAVIGHNGVGADSRPGDAANITGNRFMAPGDMKISALRAKVVALPGGNFACAVYSDNNGFADRLLEGTAPVASATNGWNTFPLASPLNLTGGHFYWFVIWTDTAGAALDTDPGGTGYMGLAGSYSWASLNGQWPDTILLTPITWETRTYCIYAEGTPLAPAPGPQMNLRGNGQLIVFGDMSPLTDNGTDFGNLPVGGSGSEHTFTIENVGSVPLQLTGAPPVAITGPQAADFQVSSPPASPVAPGASTTFTVRFTPTTTGLRTATLSIANNDIDPDKNPYQVALQGAGFVPGRESLFPDSEVGADVDNDGTRYELGTTFTPIVDGTVTELRVFSVTGDSGNHTAWIWNSDGSVLAGPYNWDFGGVNGWIYLDIPSVSVLAGFNYIVDVSTGQGPMHDYANEPGVLINGGGNGLNLAYPPSAGVFTTTLGAMPDSSWNGSSYLRDIVFLPSTTTTTFPDMVVQGNDALIQDGYSSPVGTNNTDFGHAAAGAGTVDRSFAINNAGAAPLNLTGTPQVAITGPQAADFEVLSQPATPVPPGGTSTLTIRFKPSVAGLRKALVSIQNDDKNPYYFSISGTGDVAPRITAITADLNTGNVTLQWAGQGHQVQVERAETLAGPFTNIGSPQTGSSYTDVGVLKTNASAFYRIQY